MASLRRGTHPYETLGPSASTEALEMNAELSSACAKIFRDVTGLNNSRTHFGWTDQRLLKEPLEALGIDSLTLLEFVMTVENAYDVALDEEEVNRCKRAGDLVALVVAARNGSTRN